MSYAASRKTTTELLELVDEGVLDARTVLQAALNWLEERDVKRMAEVNEFLLTYDEDEE